MYLGEKDTRNVVVWKRPKYKAKFINGIEDCIGGSKVGGKYMPLTWLPTWSFSSSSSH